MESCAEKAVDDGPDVECGDGMDGEPGEENDGVAEEADDEGVEDAEVAVCDEAWEDAGGESDAVEDDDEVERGGVWHGEGVAGEGGYL